MKKLISVILSAIIMTSLLGVTASARVERAKRVVVRPSSTTSRTLRAGRTLQLDAHIYPQDFYYDDIEWDTSDYDIADVDSYGEVYANKPGEVTIYCRLYTYEYYLDGGRPRKIRVGSGSIDLVVADKNGRLPSSSSSSVPKPEPDPATPVTKTSAAKISTNEIVEAVKGSVEKGKTTSVTFKGVGRVSAAAIKSADAAMKAAGGVVLLNFDTMTSDNKAVAGRVTINPADSANLKNDILPGIYVSGSMVTKVKDKFEKHFSNKFEVVKSMQEDTFGMRVRISARLNSDLKKSKNLKLYSYDPDTNIYFEVKNADIIISGNYAIFYTTLSEHLVLVDGTLKAK